MYIFFKYLVKLNYIAYELNTVGPCALDYSKLRIGEQFLWTDPAADELVQRNRIQSTASPPVNKKHALHVRMLIKKNLCK